jgi:hypothetical protein
LFARDILPHQTTGGGEGRIEVIAGMGSRAMAERAVNRVAAFAEGELGHDTGAARGEKQYSVRAGASVRGVARRM